MNKIALLALGLFVACNSSQKPVADSYKVGSEPDPVIYSQTITQAELREHLYTYASDEFEGRETGTPGQKKAVGYIKSAYESLGIPAAKPDGNYFQKVPLEVKKVPKGNIRINNIVFEIGEDVVTFSAVEGEYTELVYVGYGIEAGVYSDYKGLDVSEKIVLMKSGEPIDSNGDFLISGTAKPSDWSNSSESMETKAKLALDKGAKGILYFDTDNFQRYQRYFEFMETNPSEKMELVEEDNTPFIVVLNKTSAKALIADIDQDHTPRVMPAIIDLNLSNRNNIIDTENVVAFLKGSEKPEEYVIISSHLDHIGVNTKGDINNGADDDGSGTVAMLEIAEAFKKAADAGQGPKRSIVFLHVTGEEKGLLGSRYYTDMDPIFPLAQTVADLNIDMIGRIDPKRNGDRNYVYLIGSDKLSTELHDLSEEINAKYTNLALDYKYNDENDPNRFYYRSDHYNFAKNNIPIIFYFNGTHADYHRPGDTPDKINYDLLENRTRLIFHTAWEVANRPNKVRVDKVAK